MIKTLRIISILAPTLALILFVFWVVFGIPIGDRTEEFPDSPGIVEKFMSATGDEATRGKSQISPLVKQAQDFAKYLNPSESEKGNSTVLGATGIKRTLLPTSPKFKLIGTSYFEKYPELSIALIDEPGVGLHWVRQSSQVGHLSIEKIKDGLIVVKSSNETYEMQAEREPEMSLIEGASDVSKSKVGLTKSSKSNLPAVKKNVNNITRKTSKLTGPSRSVAEQTKLKELNNRLIDLQKGLKSDKTDSISSDEERLAKIEKLISDYKSESLRVSAEEAKKLEDLGEKLKDNQEEDVVVEDPNISLSEIETDNSE